MPDGAEFDFIKLNFADAKLNVFLRKRCRVCDAIIYDKTNGLGVGDGSPVPHKIS